MGKSYKQHEHSKDKHDKTNNTLFYPTKALLYQCSLCCFVLVAAAVDWQRCSCSSGRSRISECRGSSECSVVVLSQREVKQSCRIHIM